MRVAIITRSGFRSPRYLATGLQRMLKRCGAHADIYLNGISWLDAIKLRNASRRHRLVATYARAWLQFWRRYDAFVVSETIDVAGDAQLLAPLRALGKPIFLYEVFAFTGSKYWFDRVPPSAPSLFDGLLVASAIHDDPLIDGPPIFEIGLELLESQTNADAKPFMAMLDFARPGYESDRELQTEAIAELGLPSFVLDGEYSFEKIVEEYDRAAVAFLAFPEAFGVPIAQLQQRGALIATPRRRWAKRHALLPPGSVYSEADARFSENFIFYNDKQDLKDQLRKAQSGYRPDIVAQRFQRTQPHLAGGDREEIHRLLEFAISLRGKC